MNHSARPPCVLVAEDDPDDRMLIREAFEESFSECCLNFVQNGVELMAYLNDESGEPDFQSRQAPDLILLDLNMPLMDGRQALMAIKSDPKLRHLVVVIMTTSSNSDDAAFCHSHGANSYIVKPTKYSDISRIVASLRQHWVSRS